MKTSLFSIPMIVLACASAFAVTLTQEMDMNGNKITNLPTPVAASEAATKAYVDSRDVAGHDCWTNGIGEVLAATNACIDFHGFAFDRSLNNQSITRYMDCGGGLTNITTDGSDGYHSTFYGRYGDMYGGPHKDYAHGIWWRFNDPTNGEYQVLWAVQRLEYSNYLHSTAIRMFHPLIMDTQNIVNVAWPINAMDAATKGFVDAATSGIARMSSNAWMSSVTSAGWTWVVFNMRNITNGVVWTNAVAIGKP